MGHPVASFPLAACSSTRRWKAVILILRKKVEYQMLSPGTSSAEGLLWRKDQ
jgi:hypothetical protein